ncbi:3678_t:CDS:10 [Cetraspora pellucida]|uniref:3678_t:CDS:1 n=1 Tax=Cetraspora pellucida TaxID=1433469 RepID=A0A9N9GEA4_9GLOM|nr:3678_t:CDS:10 [Cetraspora pellucida]
MRALTYNDNLVIIIITIFLLTVLPTGFTQYIINYDYITYEETSVQSNLTGAPPRIIDIRHYEDNLGIAVVRVARENYISGINRCYERRLLIRVIQKNGTIIPINIVNTTLIQEIQDINYCYVNYFTLSKNPIQVYPLFEKYILITYTHATNTSDNTTFVDKGAVIDWNGTYISTLDFGPSFLIQGKWLPNSYIINNIIPSKGFLYLSTVKGTGDFGWRQYEHIGDGQFSLIQSDSVKNAPFTSFQVTVFATLNGGYALVYANTTVRNVNLTNPTIAPFSADAGIYAIMLNYNQEKTPRQIILYEMPIQNLTFTSIYCSVDHVFIGHSCIAAVVRTQTNQVPNVTTTVVTTTVTPVGAPPTVLPVTTTISAPPTTTTTTDTFYVRIRFLSSGSVLSLDPITPKSNNTLPIIKTLPLGGYALITRQYTVQSFSFSFDLYNEYDQQSNYSFPLKPIVGNVYSAYDILNNNKMLVVLNETITSWSILSIDLPALSQYNDTGYGNLHVNTTYPQIGVRNLTVNTLRISITYQDPIALNEGNLNIYQNISGNSILRLKFNARTCTQCNVSGNVITIDVFTCTFNDPLGSYYIAVDNNFIKSAEYNEPIMGIYPNVWTFATGDSNSGQRADNIYGSLRLTADGTKRFQGLSSDAKRSFTYSLIDELIDRIPTKRGRLGTTENYQLDTSDLSKVIISIAIYEKRNNDDKMITTNIRDYLDQLVRYKNYTNILTGSYTSYLDETYGYHPAISIAEYFNLHKTKFIVLFLIIAFFTLAFLGALGITKRDKARAIQKAKETGKEPEYEESENFIILQLGIALFRFGTFTAFIILDSKSIPYLFIPSMTVLVVPTAINLFLAFWVLFSDQSQNKNGDKKNNENGDNKYNENGDKKYNEKGDKKDNEIGYQKDIKYDDEDNERKYVRWFARHGRVAVTIALLSGTNIDVLLMLKSCLAGLKTFNAPFNDKSLKIIFWGACADIFLSDIPQFIIQILFITSSVLLDPIPPFTLASSGISILSSVISKIFFIKFKAFSPYLSHLQKKKNDEQVNGPDVNDVSETDIAG